MVQSIVSQIHGVIARLGPDATQRDFRTAALWTDGQLQDLETAAVVNGGTVLGRTRKVLPELKYIREHFEPVQVEDVRSGRAWGDFMKQREEWDKRRESTIDDLCIGSVLRDNMMSVPSGRLEGN